MVVVGLFDDDVAVVIHMAHMCRKRRCCVVFCTSVVPMTSNMHK